MQGVEPTLMNKQGETRVALANVQERNYSPAIQVGTVGEFWHLRGQKGDGRLGIADWG